MVTYPSDWNDVTVGDLVKTYGGLSGKRKEDFENGRRPFITYMDVYSHSVIRQPSGMVRVDESEYQNFVSPGDLLFTQSSETPDEVGKVATYSGMGQPFLNSFCFGGTPRQKFDANFLVQFLSRGAPRQAITLLAQGSTRYNLAPGRLLTLKISIPTIREQRAIAEVLSGFDGHLANLDELITKKKAIRDGAVEELVTGRTRIADYRAPWVTRSARELLSDVITGGTPSTTIAEYWDGGIPWLSSTEIHQRTVSRPTRYISEEGLANSSAQIAPAGSVLIALAGQGKTRGTSAYLTRDMALNQSLAGLVADETELYRGYLLYAVTRRYEELRGLSSGDGGRGGLNKTLLWDLRFTLPSSLEEQCAIAEVLSGMDEEIRLLAEERAKVERLKLGAMDDLLTGRVRLPLVEEAA